MERQGEPGASVSSVSVTLRHGGTYWLGVGLTVLGLVFLSFFAVVFSHPVVSPLPAGAFWFEVEAYVGMASFVVAGVAIAVPAHAVRELQIDESGLRLSKAGRIQRDLPWDHLVRLETGYRRAYQPGNPGLTWILVATAKRPARTIRLNGKAVRANLDDVRRGMRLAADYARQRGIPVREFTLDEWRGTQERQPGPR